MFERRKIYVRDFMCNKKSLTIAPLSKQVTKEGEKLFGQQLLI